MDKGKPIKWYRESNDYRVADICPKPSSCLFLVATATPPKVVGMAGGILRYLLRTTLYMTSAWQWPGKDYWPP